MNRIPLSYIFRNLWARRLTTLLTSGGMALVVYVFATVLMLEEGLRQTLVETGSPDNAVVIRKASQTEVQSGVERNQAAIIESRPEIAFDQAGERLVSKEVVVLITLNKSANNAPANVVIRGTTPQGLVMRPQVKLAAGRMFRPGSTEIVVGRSIADRFSGVALGERLRFGQREWTVVGITNAGRTGFNSEIWGDAEQMRQSFRRPVYSSVTLRLNESGRFEAMKQALENDPRMTIEVKRETVYYAEQSEVMAKFIKILGLVLSVIFSLGAVIGAMITMYASVASRTNEIGTLRALGFPRQSILTAFLVEAMLLGGVGGAIGLTLASLMQFLTLSTMNWQTFSELAFSFTLTFDIAWKSLLFSVAMGFFGGVIPAIRASRLKIVDALREH